jgi:glucosamine kinase
VKRSTRAPLVGRGASALLPLLVQSGALTGALFIGIDGGGTMCRARVRAADGALVGEGVGGPANARLDPKLVMGSILDASREALRAGGLAERDLSRAAVGLGLAGAGLRSAGARLLAEPHPFAAVSIETDAYAAWLGAHGGRDGAILILGTGSCGLAVVGGRQVYVSGWGAEVSDEASGNWIGREAMRRALWAYDGRVKPSALSDAVMARFEGSAEKAVAFATTARPADYARLVPLVFDLAGRLDAVALAIVDEASRDAGRIIARLLEAGAPSVCLLGGLAAPLGAWLPPPIKAVLAEPRGDAMEGAILMARAAAAGQPQAARA